MLDVTELGRTQRVKIQNRRGQKALLPAEALLPPTPIMSVQAMKVAFFSLLIYAFHCFQTFSFVFPIHPSNRSRVHSQRTVHLATPVLNSIKLRFIVGG